MIQRIPTERLFRYHTACVILFAATLGALALPALAAERVIDSAMDNDPKLPVAKTVLTWDPRLKPLWLKALAQPEADLQRQAADAFARAHRLGLKKLQDVAPELLKRLKADKTHPVVRLAVARTLIVLDARQSAPDLFERLAGEGAEYALVVEPALARWNFRPIRKIWIARLSESRPRRTLLRLAIRGLATVRESQASAKLWALAGDPKTVPQLRVEAAKALGRIESTGLLDRAGKLAADKSLRRLVDRLVAASLLFRHAGTKTEKLLLELAVDSQPTVSAIALRRLSQIDPRLAWPIAGSLLSRKDANVRQLACDALSTHPVVSSVKNLGPLLSDPHPGIRRFVRATLRKFAAKPELAADVRTEAMRVLHRDDWRGHEQCSLLLAQLDHKPASKRLVALLESKRPEVMESSAWALRKLAVPEMLPAMLNKATRQSATDRKIPPPDLDAFPGTMSPGMGRVGQLSHLFQAFGQMKYQPAIPLLMRFVPKSFADPEDVRASAVWALGFLETGPRAKRLAAALAGRLADVQSPMPEMNRVRLMSAVSLGRLKAREQLAVLRKFYKLEGPQSPVGLGCRWAIHELTGETLPGPKTRTKSIPGWFIEPLGSRRQSVPPKNSCSDPAACQDMVFVWYVLKLQRAWRRHRHALPVGQDLPPNPKNKA